MGEKERHVAVEVAATVRAGMPLSDGFRAMADELGKSRIAASLRAAAARLENGEPVETALEKADVPRPVRELLVAAVASGSPAEVMQELVDLSRARREMRRRIWAVFAYPSFVLAMAAVLVLFFALFLVPQFVEVFNGFEIELPGITKGVLFVLTTGLPLFVGLLCLLTAAAIGVWVLPVPASIERLTYGVPLVGRLRRYSRLERFSRLAALLIEQKRPLPDALRWAGDASGSPHLREVSRRLAGGVERGDPLDLLIDREVSLPPTMIPSVRWGRETGRLGEAFRAAESTFAARASTQCEYVAALVLPITLLVIASVIPFFVAALLLPLISLIQSLT